MSTISGNYTDSGQAVLALQQLSLHSVVSGILDLSTKRGGNVHIAYGRQGATARTAGVNILIRPMIDAGTIEHPIGPSFVGDSATATRTTCAATGNPIGTTNFGVASSAGFAAGDAIFIDDTGNVGLGNSEFARVQYVPDSTHINLDRPTQFAHNSASAHVSNHADIIPEYWLNGGKKWEIIVDDGASSTGDTNAVRCLYDTYDSDNVA